MYGNKRKESSKATATIIISESKLLDLNSLLNLTNGNSIGSSSSKNHKSTTQQESKPKFHSEIIENPQNNDQLNALLQKASTSNGNGLILDDSSLNLRLCFSGNYIFFKDIRVPPTREFGESGVQFKCTFPGCFKRLSTNINFIYHVWAHASQLNFKVPSNGSLYNIIYGISDVQRAVSEKPLLRCLECLAEFTSTTKLYKHQFYVHRYRKTIDHSIVCHICEKQVDMVNAEKHADRHGEFEMPFKCPLCEWRSSSRHSLMFHFERTHNASTMLICPFCLDKFTARRPSTVKSERSILTCPQFVEHILEHFQEGVKKSNCPRCSLKFSADSFSELTQKLKFHAEMHKSASKLKFERKGLKELFESNPNQRVAAIKALSPLCADCGYRIKSLDSHYRKKECCENEGCPFETKCRMAIRQHLALCPLKSDPNLRLPFGKPKLADEYPINSLTKEKARLQCSLCPFVISDAAIFNEHVIKECRGAKPLENSKSRVESPKKRQLSIEDKNEVDLFGVHLDVKRFKQVDSTGFLDTIESDEKPNWLSKIVPFITDKSLIVLKKSSIIKSVSIVDNINVSATNDFFRITDQFCQDYEERIAKLAQRMFPPSQFPKRRL